MTRQVRLEEATAWVAGNRGRNGRGQRDGDTHLNERRWCLGRICIEKLDINEEKVRLANHIKYFRETMQKENTGKKLGFIAQEIGREINTVGSKSNYAPMQQYVVQMKDELEKIKEQIGNTL